MFLTFLFFSFMQFMPFMHVFTCKGPFPSSPTGFPQIHSEQAGVLSGSLWLILSGSCSQAQGLSG